jgi:hypothetical protein
MHPVIRQQLVADRIRGIHASADTERRARQTRRPRRRAPSIRLSGVVAGVLGVVHTFGEQRSALVRRGDGLHKKGGALEDVRVGLADEGEELLVSAAVSARAPNVHRRHQ